MSAVRSAEASLAPLPDRPQLEVNESVAGVISIDPEVDFRPFQIDGEGVKTIAYLGITQAREVKRWRTVLRLGGSHIVFGKQDDSVNQLYEQSLASEVEHPSFFKDLLKDIAITAKMDGVNALDPSLGIMDFAFLAPCNGSPRDPVWTSLYSPKQCLNSGAREYTRQIVKLVFAKPPKN